MEKILLKTPQKMTETTILSGNTDVNNYLYCILDTQIRVLEPLLGTLLYEKIKADLDTSTLTGLYLELFSDYIKPITKFESVSSYIEIAQYMVTNGGIFKHAPDSKEIVEPREVTGLAQKYHSTADTFIIRLKKWFCDNGSQLSEYTYDQDGVKPHKNLRTIEGWKL